MTKGQEKEKIKLEENSSYYLIINHTKYHILLIELDSYWKGPWMLFTNPIILQKGK